MKVHNVFVSVAMFFFLTAAVFAQQVKTDYDRSANFDQYKTYSWQKVETKDPLWVDRIKSAVDAALTAKGWTQATSDGNVSLVAIEATKNQQTLNTFYDGFGGGWRWGGFGNATTTVDNYKVGTLVLDMFDTQTKKLIWRGSSRDSPSNENEKNNKKLRTRGQKMLTELTPAPNHLKRSSY